MNIITRTLMQVGTGNDPVRGMLMNIITRALMQVGTGNGPVPRLATNQTNIAVNKLLCHIRKVALSQITKRKCTSKTLHCAAMRRSYAPVEKNHVAVL